MHVIATAGHVDHGKSALVRALTGMEPDRWAEERRRGMTIDLGYAWTSLEGGEVLAFVDVPGHERFLTNLLAGVGPVPAVLMVLAADGGWAVQSEEHLRVLAALGIRQGVLAVTRADLADPGPALAAGTERLAAAGLTAEGVAVSAVTGEGLDTLRAALARLVAGLPTPVAGERTRLWVDRVFTVSGSGTVVTGTLATGTLATGGAVVLGERTLQIRGMQELGEPVERASAVARVAVNLRGLERGAVRRGDALLNPGGWRATDLLDARLTGPDPDTRTARRLVLHAGSAAVPVTVRTLAGDLARLRLDHPLPLQVGDRAVLRDPGSRAIRGLIVIDPLPPPLDRSGAARRRAVALAGDTGVADAARDVDRRGAVRLNTLTELGVDVPPAGLPGVHAAAGWLVSDLEWQRWRERALAAVEEAPTGDLLERGVSRGALLPRLGLPDEALLDPVLASCPDLLAEGGRVHRRDRQAAAPPELAAAVEHVLGPLSHTPFAAPAQGDLTAAGLGARELGAAAAAGLLLRLPGDVVLRPDAVRAAVELLAGLPEPFTVSQAREALGTTRRVAVPLLEHLDRVRITIRVTDTGRALRR